MKLVNGIALFCLGALILLLPIDPAFTETPAIDKIMPVHLQTIPLGLKRIYDPSDNLPEGSGLFIRRVKEGSQFYKQGIRSGMVLKSLNNRPTSTRKNLVKTLADSLGSTVTISVWDNVYSQDTWSDSFIFELVQNKVTAFDPSPLYHDPRLEHSPDRNEHLTYKSPTHARASGNQPCPVCFPGNESTIWSKVIEASLGSTNSFVRQLIKKYGTIDQQPEFITHAFNNIKQHRLRYQMEPRLFVIDTQHLYASGTPDGSIVLSKGLITFAEGLNQKRLLLAHMLAHADLRHPPRSVTHQQATSILKQGIKRVPNVGIGLQDVGEFLFSTFGMTNHRRWQGLGYEQSHEHMAKFLQYYYLRKIDVPFSASDLWKTKRRDLVRNLREEWANYLVIHPEIDRLNMEPYWKQQLQLQYSPETPSGKYPTEKTGAK